MAKSKPGSLFLAVCVTVVAMVSTFYVAGCLLWYAKLRIQEKVAPKTIQNGFVRHPFLTGDQIPNQSLLQTVTKDGKTFTYGWKLNGQACRDDVEYTVEKTPGVTRWMCLGGSVLVTGTSNTNTIPFQIQKLLNEGDAKHRMEFYNFGRVGWDSTQMMLAFATEFRKYRPDFLLVYSGRNDAFQAVMPVYRPFWNAWSFEIDRELNQRSYLKELFFPIWRLKESWLALRHPREYYQREAHVRFQEKQSRELDFYQSHGEVESVYAGNLENLFALAREGGCKGVVLALQPQIHWCGKPMAKEEEMFDSVRIQPTWRQAMKEIYPAIQKAHEEAARSSSLPILTLNLNETLAHSKDLLFMDDCHLTDLGNDIVAATLVPFTRRLMQEEMSSSHR